MDGFLVVPGIMFMQPYQRADKWTVATGVFRRVSRSPGNAAMFGPGGVERTVPSIEYVCGKIFRFVEVSCFASKLVRMEQFPNQPLLIVIYVFLAGYLGATLGGCPVHTVDRPLPGLRK